MRGRGGVVSVVDANDDNIFVWWVNLAEKPSSDMQRLCGSWTLEVDDHVALESLTFARIPLATRSGTRALTAAELLNARMLDPNQTLAAAIADRNKHQAVFDAEQTKRVPSKRLRQPTWPIFPSPLNIESPPPWTLKQPMNRPADKALSISHWLSALCSRWEDFESERLARPWLSAIEGSTERDLPLIYLTN